MSNELTLNQAGELAHVEQHLSAAQIKAQVQVLQQVMQEVMKEDVHYGIIPGTEKPTLYKSGAEKIMATFRLAAEPEVQDLSTSDEVHYRVIVRLISPSGVSLGAGIGECSSSEEKYKWKRPVCDKEFDATPEDRRRIKFAKKKKGESGFWENKQVRTEPADMRNTVLKMAKKRALVDAVLTVTAASDIFDQDLEDLPPGMEPAAGAPPPVSRPQSRSGGARKQQQAPAGDGEALHDGQKRIIRKKLTDKGLTEDAMCQELGYASLDVIPAAKVNEVLEWLAAIEESDG